MTCYHPLIRVEYQNVWVTAKDGHKFKKGKILKTDEYEKFKKINDENVEIQRIPCGQCIGCRLDYSKMWATRCMCEANQWTDNWFITLTYDEENLPIPEQIIDKETGTIYTNKYGNWQGCLQPKDLQLFIKRLRSFYKRHYNHDNIRFYACGEYGSERQRPHYHIICFNLPVPPEKLEHLFNNEDYEPIYKCQEIEQCWGKGLVAIGKVTWSSCAYVARYVTKKIRGQQANEYYYTKGQIPEFVRMSRKPGIGKDFYEANKQEIYDLDYLLAHTCKGNSLTVKPPKYFDKLYEIENPKEYEELKKKRKEAGERSENIKQGKTSLTIKNQGIIEEQEKLRQAAALKRSL